MTCAALPAGGRPPSPARYFPPAHRLCEMDFAQGETAFFVSGTGFLRVGTADLLGRAVNGLSGTEVALFETSYGLSGLPDALSGAPDALSKLTVWPTQLVEWPSKLAESRARGADSCQKLAERPSKLAESHAELPDWLPKLADFHAELSDYVSQLLVLQAKGVYHAGFITASVDEYGGGAHEGPQSAVIQGIRCGTSLSRSRNWLVTAFIPRICFAVTSSLVG
jgi:hypothetical protein